jgi:RNA polymerase sigma-70 factor (ECF subfamily)
MGTTYMTRGSLLVRMQNMDDTDAWETFYQRYSALIFSFSLKRGCSEQMCNDVLQETMVTLMRIMPKFEYNRKKGQFRSYLLKIVHNHIINAYRRDKKYLLVEPDDHALSASAANADKTPQQQVCDEWDKEWQQHLMRIALDRVADRLTPKTMEVFRMYVLEQTPVNEVCEKMDVNRNTVYQHRARVIRMLQEEIAGLQEELGDDT